MASQPPRVSSSPRHRAKGRKKTPPPERRVRPPVDPVSDHTAQRSGLSWATLARAVGCFKMSLSDIRRGGLLSSLNPLAMEQRLPEKRPMPEKKFWGDQEPLSKIPFQILSGHQHLVSSCHFCVDDTKLLSGSFDCTVKLWDAVDGSIIRDFEHRPEAPVLECSVTADSRRITASAYDKTLRTWDLETGKLLWKIGHENLITACNFSPDGKYVVAGLDVDHGICLTDAINAQILIHIKDHHKRSVTACCFDPDSQKVASVSLDRSIKIWDVTSQATLFTITNAHSNAISNCCFTFSGHFLCTSSWDKTLKIWNIHTGEFRNRGACVTLMQGHEGSVSSCHFARDSKVASGGSGQQWFWLLVILEKAAPSDDASTSPMEDSHWLSLGRMPISEPITIAGDERRKQLFGEDDPSRLSFCVAASFLVSGGFDKSVTIWDVGEGYRKLSLKGHNDWVMDVAISSNKKWILSASKDRTMRLWNIEEIDQIPLVIQYKKALGLTVKQCEECDRPFSVYESDIFSEVVTKCVFCRMEAKDLPAEASSSEKDDSPARGSCLGKDGGHWVL